MSDSPRASDIKVESPSKVEERKRLQKLKEEQKAAEREQKKKQQQEGTVPPTSTPKSDKMVLTPKWVNYLCLFDESNLSILSDIYPVMNVCVSMAVYLINLRIHL